MTPPLNAPFCVPQFLDSDTQNLRKLRDDITGVATFHAAGAALPGQLARVLMRLGLAVPELGTFRTTTLVLDAYVDAAAGQAAFANHIEPVLASTGLSPQAVSLNQAGAQPRFIGCRTGIMDDLGGHQPHGVMMVFELANTDPRTASEAYAEACTEIDETTGGVMPDGALIHLALDISVGRQARIAIVEVWRDADDLARFAQTLGLVLTNHRIPEPRFVEDTMVIDYTIGLSNHTWPRTANSSTR